MVREVVQEDMGEANMQCTNHPYKNSPPGGICAFCLQEKLGKLVSSFPVTVFLPSTSSPSPSFRSEFGGNSISTTTSAAASSLVAIRPNAAASSTYGKSSNNGGDCNNYNHHLYYNKRSKLLFLSTHRKKKKKEAAMAAAEASSIVFKRSKSTTTPKRRGMHFLEEAADDSEDYSPHKKGFWSFLYLSSSRNHTTKKLSERGQKEVISFPSSMNGGSMRSRENKINELVVVEENESPDEAAINRKVSRSRSVGCGSRRISGDFFERISTGFGDCTLRRVESQREGKHKVHRNSCVGNGGQQDCSIIKERVKCGGIFRGFMITSSSSSSSSSSYLVSSSNEDNNNGRTSTTPSSSVRHLAHGRSKSWGWAFASPMRAFTKPSNGKKDSSNKNAAPNLAAIPSLLAVSS